jgi:hypothetical protein
LNRNATRTYSNFARFMRGNCSIVFLLDNSFL